jgi:hypothetical protein
MLVLDSAGKEVKGLRKGKCQICGENQPNLMGHILLAHPKQKMSEEDKF